MSKKLELIFTREETGEFLRLLADALEKGDEYIDDYDFPIAGLRKVKISLSKEQMDVQLKVKYDKKDKVRRYKKLKKRMKVYFDEIKTFLEKDEIPSKEIVSVFLEDSRTMLSYFGFGDEFYDEYKKLCKEFKKAVKAEEIASIKEIFALLEASKERCHEIYKK
jgi:XXXCH domain-containing protein